MGAVAVRRGLEKRKKMASSPFKSDWLQYYPLKKEHV